jgi:hypothetical protein
MLWLKIQKWVNQVIFFDRDNLRNAERIIMVGFVPVSSGKNYT